MKIITSVTLILAIALFVSTQQSLSEESPIKVTILGSDNVAISAEQFGPSVLVQAGGQTFLFDSGRGVPIRINQAGVEFSEVDKIFITHLHSDHVIGLPDIWLMGWFAGRRENPLNVWGPKGINNLVTHMEQAFSYDVHIRTVDMNVNPKGASINVKEIEEGVIFEKEGVKITAIRVDHGMVKDAFGYRLDYKGYSMALSGDTRKNDNLVKLSKGVDLMLHAVMAPRFYGADKYPKIYDKVRVRHTIPTEAGEVFTSINPRIAVIYHRNAEEGAEIELLGDTRKKFAGDLYLAEDLMTINIGKEITVKGGVH